MTQLEGDARPAVMPGQTIASVPRADPFFSICIPQYNRTRFLIQCCRSLMQQEFTNFEVCISDDCSTDGRQAERIEFLRASGLSFVYHARSVNGRYDANLRSSMALARGRYCFLLGNDDALVDSTVLRRLNELIHQYAPVDVVVTNYEDFATGRPARRVTSTRVVGSGVEVAAAHFRNLSFVSGILLDRPNAVAQATLRWDGSEMYQMFVASRMVAAGGRLLHVDQVTVRKDIAIAGDSVDSYASRARLWPCPITERHLPLGQIPRLVADAVCPYQDPGARDRTMVMIALQLYLFTYPFWIVEYRRVQSWRFALGVCLGLRPRSTTAELKLAPLSRLKLRALYAATSAVGLVFPLGAFDTLRARLYRLAKTWR